MRALNARTDRRYSIVFTWGKLSLSKYNRYRLGAARRLPITIAQRQSDDKREIDSLLFRQDFLNYRRISRAARASKRVGRGSLSDLTRVLVRSVSSPASLPRPVYRVTHWQSKFPSDTPYFPRYRHIRPASRPTRPRETTRRDREARWSSFVFRRARKNSRYFHIIENPVGISLSRGIQHPALR